MGLKDFFGSFTGSTQARRLKDANNQATQNLNAGFDAANKYSDQAYNMYNPMVQQGNRAYGFYQNALGMNGANAANRATQQIYNNPLFNNMNNIAQQETNRLYNARGDSAGGNAMLASQMALQKNLQNYLGLYRDMGNRGDTALNNQANIVLNKGNLAYGKGATQAGQAINYGNARAAADGIFMNNLINSVGAVTGGGGVKLPSFGSNEPVFSQAGTQANGGWTTNAVASQPSGRFGLQLGNSFFGYGA